MENRKFLYKREMFISTSVYIIIDMEILSKMFQKEVQERVDIADKYYKLVKAVEDMGFKTNLSMEVPVYASKYRINLSLDHLTDRNSALILAWTESGKGSLIVNLTEMILIFKYSAIHY
ncbi:unnamed protein product [Rhizophagus irregularis]|nr:unnamed protein product [Rhizophagus irregularis]